MDWSPTVQAVEVEAAASHAASAEDTSSYQIDAESDLWDLPSLHCDPRCDLHGDSSNRDAGESTISGEWCQQTILNVLSDYFDVLLQDCVRNANQLPPDKAQRSNSLWGEIELWFQQQYSSYDDVLDIELEDRIKEVLGYKIPRDQTWSFEPVDTIIHAFTTLSPMNTGSNWNNRHYVLIHVEHWARMCLGPKHALTIIYDALGHDLNIRRCSKLPWRALQVMSRIANARLGHAHTISRRLVRSMVQLGRLSGQDAVAETVTGALALEEQGIPCAGDHLAKTAAVELDRVLRRLGVHGHVLTLRFKAQQNAHFRRDGDAVHTLEDASDH